MGPRPAQLLRTISAALILSAAAFAAPVVTITAPAASATVGTTVQVTANATGTAAVTLMQVYVDGSKKYEVRAASVSTSLSMASGSHKVTVVAYDSASSAKASVSFTVGTASAVPSSAITSANIDQLTGWSSCDVCAGPGGAGTAVAHSISYGETSPARDGNAMKVHIGDSTAVRYGAALWWQYVNADDSATNLVYDLYFYLKSPSLAQALEFDVNQTRSADGVKYIYGTECDIKMTHTWRVYDNYNKKWTSTGIPCATPTAYTWHHLTWEFQRTSTGPVFVAVTLDGVKSYANVQVQKRTGTGTGSHLNVAVQLDGNSITAPYDEWVDGVKLTHW